ncbi:hypothetical protein [Streptomyces sp. SID13726]|uniref:hypothetical protein n=1 Tax=Streptomyces sp. SID13726 TaxID=2706058 RepID=UPI0013B9B5A4|nr:hypothetical protein [Streptomyces sp. SID13726]NEB03256.1 hypothetical protein [Streptomyces sp. SID13726]
MSSHRKPRSTSPLTRRAVRVGLFAAGVAGVATAVPAQAASGGPSKAVAIASDHVFSRANRLDHTETKDSFTIRQFGKVKNASVRNQANAVSSGCSADDACRSVALSFQIVTYAGEQARLNAVNLSDAANKSCDGCQTLAGAYQFVVATPNPLTLDSAHRRQLADIHRRLDALTRSRTPATELRAQADALAAEVDGVLKDAVANAPKGDAKQDVTMRRHLDGWPGR